MIFDVMGEGGGMKTAPVLVYFIKNIAKLKEN